ncbi:hypothetical protein BC833DRAFT_565038 [Globomyces pollinis-pini]|nr:hypothetical protein BC833DRAFT_565038 [Globomyces pollinis-pini]
MYTEPRLSNLNCISHWRCSINLTVLEFKFNVDKSVKLNSIFDHFPIQRVSIQLSNYQTLLEHHKLFILWLKFKENFLNAIRQRWGRRRAEEEALRERCANLERLKIENDAKLSALEIECTRLQERVLDASNVELSLNNEMDALRLELAISDVKNAELTMKLLKPIPTGSKKLEYRSSVPVDGVKQSTIQQPSTTTLVEHNTEAEWDFCLKDYSVPIGLYSP